MVKSPFPELVRRRMREQGLGLREVCRRARLDASFFSKVLSGKRSPPWDEAALRRLAGALDLGETLLIVSAGRVPTEWADLLQDPAVIESLRRMTSSAWTPSPSASGGAAPSRRPSQSRSEAAPAAIGVKAGLGDELL